MLGQEPDASGTPLAYTGPGAGFAVLGSFLSAVAGVLLGAFSLLLWPFRMAWRVMHRHRGFRPARMRKLIFLGLDGLDPKLAEPFPDEGKLPNLGRLRRTGDHLEGVIEGPEDASVEGGGALRVPFRIAPRPGSGEATRTLQGESHALRQGV